MIEGMVEAIGLEEWARRKAMVEEVGEVVRGQIMEDFVGHGKNFGSLF